MKRNLQNNPEATMTEYAQWEYRVETIGSAFGTKDGQIQDTLDEWGEKGWKAINVYTLAITAK